MEAFDRNSDGTDPNFYDNFLWMMPSLIPDNCEFLRPPNFPDVECQDPATFFFDAPFIPDDIAMAGFWPGFYPQEQPAELKPAQVKSVPLPRPVLHYNSSNRIGTLSYEERHIKVQKYLEKRSRRSFAKKIAYNCRKRVADSRLRVKGRFITKAQAQAMRVQESKRSI
jgi:hypothetical protein